MGNRAVITTAPYGPNNTGIYLRWNGGRASIEGFLRACKRLGFRSPAVDQKYALARLTQVIATFFGNEGLPVGIGPVSHLDVDNGDNGTYLIGGDWEIVGRKFVHTFFHEEIDEAKTGQIAYKIVQQLKATETVAEIDPDAAKAWNEEATDGQSA